VGWLRPNKPALSKAGSTAATTDAKRARHAVKRGGKTLVRKVKSGTKTAVHDTKRGTKKVVNKTKSTTNGTT
jgi:hypothetical protein